MEPTLQNKAPVGAEAGKIEKGSERVLVKSSDQPLTLLSLDAKGAELLFDGREDFVILSDAEVKQLSADNRKRYGMAQQQHEVWMSNKSSTLEDEFASAQYSGRAIEKMYKMTTDPNFKYRWTDPKNVQDRLALGYTIVRADEARTFLGATRNHHEIAMKGITDSVLMKIPVATWEKRQKARAEKNRLAAGQATDRFDQEARQAGVGIVKDEPKDGRDWKELGVASK